MRKKLKIGILGAGGIGALLGSIFQKQGHEVTFLKKNSSNKNKFIKYEIRSNFFGNFKINLNFGKNKFYKSEVIFITVKYPDLSGALKKLKPLKKKVVVISLMNGLGHVEILKKIFKKNLVIGSVGHIASYKKSPNSIKHLSVTPPVLMLSAQNKNLLKKLEIIKNHMQNTGVHTQILLDNKKVIWEKLIRLNALATMTSLYGCNLGKIRNSKRKFFYFKQLILESIKVAKLDGFRANYKKILRKIKELPDNLTTSMQRDLKERKNSEIESITAGIIKKGMNFNLRLKYHEKLYQIIKKKYEI